MGLIDFVKSAGEKLFGKDDEPKVEKGTANDPEAVAKAQALFDRTRAARIAEVIEKAGFEVEELAVKVKDGVVTLQGKVPSQEEREKVVLVAGNNRGISRVDDQLEVEAPEPEATFYTVQSGDTLSKIAKEHYGNAMKYPVIFEANRPMLSDPDKIYPGQVLRIPPLEN